MFKSLTQAIILIILIALISACGPAATPIPLTATSLPPTAVPPTAVPPTVILPTAVSTTEMPPTVAPTLAPAASQAINLETAAQLGQAAVFDQPASFVHTVTFSPDSRYLITADQNGDVVIREVGTWKEYQRFPTQADTSSASLSPDGMMIVTGGAAGSVTAWDLAGNVLFSIPYSGAVFCTQFSPDGRYLAVAGEDDQVMIVDVAAQQKVTALVSDHHYVSNLVFSSDSKTLLVGYERPENVIKIWDTSTWKESTAFSHVTERIDYHDLVFSPDGRYLVVASTQNAIKFLDVATWQVVKEFQGHTRGTYQIAFSPDGALLVSACDDDSLRLWDVEAGDSIKTIRGYRENIAVDLSSDGTLIAFSGWEEGVQVWAVSPAAARSSPAPTPAPQTVPDTLPITPDTVEEIELLRALEGHTDLVYDLAFTPDVRYLASGSIDGTVRLWDVTSGQTIHTLRHSGGVCRLAMSPDGRLLASGGLDRTVKLWDLETGQVVHTFGSYNGTVCGLDFSPDGTLLATGSVDQSVKLWDIASGQLRHTLSGHTSAVFSVAFAPDGAWLASGSARPELHIKLWDVASGQVARDLRGHNGNVFGTAFSADGTLLASSGDDGTVRLWDVAAGRALRALRPGGEGLAVAFSPNGSLLAYTGADNQVHLWGIPPE